ncbi:MAG: aminopeptidase, partial [Halobacteriales archaeon]
MDERIHRHADILVEQCTNVEPGDDVIVRAPPVAEDLVVALNERLGEVGANSSLEWASARASRAWAQAMAVEDFRTPEHALAGMEETDAVILVKGAANVAEMSDVDPEKRAAWSRATEPVFRERLETRWVITQYPAPGNAQKAEMSTAAYEDFVWGAIDKDWEAQRAFQQELADILTEGEAVRIVSGDTTDVRMSIAGMTGENDWGTRNMPAGEAFTVPVPDSAEGEVLFDKPVVRQGRELTDVYLRFAAGEVIDYDAAQHVDVLESTLETDDGARRLGELGIGMNRAIDRFTYNMLFDEKMG